MASSFPLRFKDARTKRMLRLVAQQTGRSMNDLAEDAIRHELILLGAGIEEQLAAVVEALRSYRAEDVGRHAAAVAEGESLGDPVQARQLTEAEVARAREVAGRSVRNPALARALDRIAAT